jgi:hypothetical protein
MWKALVMMVCLVFPSASPSPCPRGTYSNHTNCLPCPIGTYNPIESGTCQFCEHGSVANSTGSTTCHTCESGKVAIEYTDCICKDSTGWNVSSESCEFCSPGKYSFFGYCKSCDLGFYSAEKGATTCQVCLGDVSQDKSSCRIDFNCSYGSVHDPMRYGVCVCDVGFYRDDGACIVCDAGSYSDLLDSDSCFPCGEGDWSDPNQSTCYSCSSESSSSDYYHLQCDSATTSFTQSYGFICISIVAGLALYGFTVRYLRDKCTARRMRAPQVLPN